MSFFSNAFLVRIQEIEFWKCYWKTRNKLSIQLPYRWLIRFALIRGFQMWHQSWVCIIFDVYFDKKHQNRVTHDSGLERDHLGMYLKQTLVSNIYWQTQRNIMHCSNTQGGPLYLWHKAIPYLEGLTCRTWSKWHPALRTGAARLAVGRVWLFSPHQSMFLEKGMYRRLQLCWYWLAFHVSLWTEK